MAQRCPLCGHRDTYDDVRRMERIMDEVRKPGMALFHPVGGSVPAARSVMSTCAKEIAKQARALGVKFVTALLQRHRFRRFLMPARDRRKLFSSGTRSGGVAADDPFADIAQ